MHAVAYGYSDGALNGFFDDLVRCETRLYNALGETLKAEHGIGTAQFELLRYVRDHPDARVAGLATTFATGIGAMSKAIDRLAGREWLHRTANPDDGRSSLLNLTEAGRALADAAETDYLRRLAELVSPATSAADVEAARRVLAALRRSLEGTRVGLPIG